MCSSRGAEVLWPSTFLHESLLGRCGCVALRATAGTCLEWAPGSSHIIGDYQTLDVAEELDELSTEPSVQLHENVAAEDRCDIQGSIHLGSDGRTNRATKLGSKRVPVHQQQLRPCIHILTSSVLAKRPFPTTMLDRGMLSLLLFLLATISHCESEICAWVSKELLN